jgi:hypothetical protein
MRVIEHLGQSGFKPAYIEGPIGGDPSGRIIGAAGKDAVTHTGFLPAGLSNM